MPYSRLMPDAYDGNMGYAMRESLDWFDTVSTAFDFYSKILIRKKTFESP